LDRFEVLIAENGRQPAPRGQGLVMAVGRYTTGQATVVPAGTGAKEVAMNEDVFNASIRKFLKALGVTA
jgi:hypothetical protein